MTEPVLRAARAEDAAEIAALLRRSITELCAEDHLGDPAALAGWLANKTPEAVRRWVADPGQRVLVAEIMGRLAGVGSASDDGVVLLNYVSPDFVRRGVSAAILAGLEAWLAARGVAESRLESTRTAHGFYRARGYRELGAPGPDARPMAKPLAPVPVGLVIFDCDGVLVDSEPIAMRILVETIAGAGVTLDPGQAQALLLGKSLASMREILARDFELVLSDAALDAMRHRLYAAFRAELRPIPGIAGTLDVLRTAFCVASSSQPERIKVALTATGLWPRFAGRVFSATMVARGKPAPDLFLFAAQSLGHTPSACLVVEDSPAGIIAAQSAGMRVVAFTGGSHATSGEHRASIEALRPEAVLAEMRGLPELVGRLARDG